MSSVIVVGGVQFDEEDGSPTFKVAMRNITYTQTGLIAWNDINAFVSYLIAPTAVYGELLGVFAGAGFPDNANMRVVDIDIKPFGTITGGSQNNVNIYNYARVVITYSNLLSQLNQGDPTSWLQHQWDIGGKWLAFNGTNCKWVSDGKSPGSQVTAGILIPTTEMSITWPRLVQPPFDAIRSLTGAVNAEDFPFATGIAPAETMLFLGAKVTRDILSGGQLAWSFTYKFSQQIVVAADQAAPGGWNHFFRNDGAVTAGFYRMQAFGSYPIYRGVNFTPLFQVGA